MPDSREQVEILRDRWGVAHVYAEAEVAGFYGLGYASAQDRMFQMMIKRRSAQGRIAEILGPGRDNRFLDADRRARAFGFARRAREKLARVAPDTCANLDAYAAGVNAYLRQYEGRLGPLFARNGGHPDPWTAADCITIWDHLDERFSFGWQNEIAAHRARRERRAKGETEPPLEARPLMDDSPQICPPEEFQSSYPDVYELLAAETEQVEAAIADGNIAGPPEVKLSHNWLVGGRRSTTGMPILESDPQYGVNNPAFWYEFHLAAGRYNTRGCGVPGVPCLLIGWNERIAWGATGLGGDDADLFEERLNPDNPNQYEWQGQWRDLELLSETIRVKDNDDVEMTIRQTHHGPLLDSFRDDLAADEVFAICHTVWASPNCSVQGNLAVMRASDWGSFRDGVREVVGPALHLIYADIDGNTGYQVQTTTPIRRGNRDLPRQGWTGEEEWEFVPFEQLPSMWNPKRGYIVTANHMAAGSWYPYRIGTGIGCGPRGWRLIELFEAEPDRRFSVRDFAEQIHKDSTNPAVRDFVRCALTIVAQDGAADDKIEAAVRLLADWDCRLLVTSPAFALGRGILDCLQETFTRGTGQEARYPEGWAGVCAMFNDIRRQLDESGEVPGDELFRRWVTGLLRHAFDMQSGAFDMQQDTTGWVQQVDPSKVQGRSDSASKYGYADDFIRRMPYQDTPAGFGADGFGSFDANADLESPPLVCPLTQTVWSQEGNSYCQIVDLGNLDNSLSMLAPGVSENPDDPHYADQMSIWAEGGMRAAPLTREGVEGVKESQMWLVVD